MKADHFDQQKLLALAAEDVALGQLAHRRRTLPENAAVEAAAEKVRSASAAASTAATSGSVRLRYASCVRATSSAASSSSLCCSK